MELSEYLISNGIKQGWFARQIGMSGPVLTNYILTGRPISFKYFSKIIEATNGEVGIYDLLKTYDEFLIDFDLKEFGDACVITFKSKGIATKSNRFHEIKI